MSGRRRMVPVTEICTAHDPTERPRSLGIWLDSYARSIALQTVAQLSTKPVGQKLTHCDFRQWINFALVRSTLESSSLPLAWFNPLNVKTGAQLGRQFSERNAVQTRDGGPHDTRDH